MLPDCGFELSEAAVCSQSSVAAVPAISTSATGLLKSKA